jgi:hypothetical protein
METIQGVERIGREYFGEGKEWRMWQQWRFYKVEEDIRKKAERIEIVDISLWENMKLGGGY